MAIKVFNTLGLVSLPRVSYRGTDMQEQDPHASSVITHSGRFIIYSPTHEPCPCFQPRKKLHSFQGTDPKAKCIHTQQHMCISIQQKKKKIHERSDHPFGTNNLLVLQMWYRFERKLALRIPFCTRPEPTAVRAAPTSAYVIHLYLQEQRQNK